MTEIETTDCPYYLLTRASLAGTAMMRRELAAAGAQEVRPAYLGVLVSLWKEDGLKAGELGRRAGLEPSTMTGLLDRMERDGLLERRADPADRRAHRIHLTAAGRAADEPVSRMLTDVLERMLAGIGPEDLEAFKAALRQVLINATQRSAVSRQPSAVSDRKSNKASSA